MSKLIEYQTSDGPVLIAVKSGETDVLPVANLEETIEKATGLLRSSFRTISRIADDFVESLRECAATVSTAELEFGLDLTGKGTLYVVETTAAAAFKVKLIIDLEK